MKTYLITGGCGFIGSHLCDALIDQGHRVRVLDNLSTGHVENLPADAELIVDDVGDARAVLAAMAGVDGCFHLAAVASVERSVDDWAGTHRTNLGGAINVFDAARRQSRPVPVVYASSAAVYGDNASVPLGESEQPRPLTPYGADKLGCELHARVASVIHGVPTTGFRFFNVFGPRQDPDSPYSGVISIFIDRLLSGEPLTIHGDGQQSRDFIYVADVIRYLLAGMAECREGTQVFNACTGHSTTILQLARTIASLGPEVLRIEHVRLRSGDIHMSLGDPRRARRLLNVGAEMGLAEGLRWTVDHQRAVSALEAA